MTEVEITEHGGIGTSQVFFIPIYSVSSLLKPQFFSYVFFSSYVSPATFGTEAHKLIFSVILMLSLEIQVFLFV